MNLLIKHVVMPTGAPALVVGLYLTPVTVFGCATRGLMALAVVFASALAAFVAIGFAFRARARGEAGHGWWLVSAIILTLPLVLVLGPLG